VIGKEGGERESEGVENAGGDKAGPQGPGKD